MGPGVTNDPRYTLRKCSAPLNLLCSLRFDWGEDSNSSVCARAANNQLMHLRSSTYLFTECSSAGYSDLDPRALVRVLLTQHYAAYLWCVQCFIQQRPVLLKRERERPSRSLSPLAQANNHFLSHHGHVKQSVTLTHNFLTVQGEEINKMSETDCQCRDGICRNKCVATTVLRMAWVCLGAQW